MYAVKQTKNKHQRHQTILMDLYLTQKKRSKSGIRGERNTPLRVFRGQVGSHHICSSANTVDWVHLQMTFNQCPPPPTTTTTTTTMWWVEVAYNPPGTLFRIADMRVAQNGCRACPIDKIKLQESHNMGANFSLPNDILRVPHCIE